MIFMKITERFINKQKHLNDKLFLVFIAFLGAFIPLSTDAYLPALPKMVDSLNTTMSMVNLTLVLFFIFYAVGTLFWGPLSDRYGRKPVLLIGLVIYTIASILCIFAFNIYMLIICRILQAFGCGAAATIAMAIVKDVYSGNKRIRTLGIVQTISTTSPIVSPVLGALILQFFSWKAIFVLFSIIGILSILGTILIKETIGQRSEGTVRHSLSRLISITKNKGFMSLLLMFSLQYIPHMFFISASAYIYVNGFHVSETVYSHYFAVNAVFLLLGPLFYMRISKWLHYRTFIRMAYFVITLSGIFIVGIGSAGPIECCLALIPAELLGNALGAPRTNLMLEQVENDTGAAASMMGCVITLFGSLGMSLVSVNFINIVFLLGGLYIFVGILSLSLWHILWQKPYVKQV